MSWSWSKANAERGFRSMAHALAQAHPITNKWRRLAADQLHDIKTRRPVRRNDSRARHSDDEFARPRALAQETRSDSSHLRGLLRSMT